MSGSAPSSGWRQNLGSSALQSGRSSLLLRRLLMLGLTIVLATALITLVMSLLVNRVAPAHVVAIGMTYNHAAFDARGSALRTAENFKTLNQLCPRTFVAPPDFRESRLDAESFLREFGPSLKQRSEKTLLVYCNALGTVTGEGEPAAQLITVSAETKADEFVPITEFLKTLSLSPAERIVVFFDGYQGVANGRMGLFNQDFARQLFHECEDAVKANPRLSVLCAAGPGQLTWQSEVPGDGLFVFGKAVVDGLSGKADGMGLDARGNARANNHRRNQRVSLLELVAYAQSEVQAWSEKNRGLNQQVQVFSQSLPMNDFEIVEIPTQVPKLSSPSPTPDPAADKKAADKKASEAPPTEPKGGAVAEAGSKSEGAAGDPKKEGGDKAGAEAAAPEDPPSKPDEKPKAAEKAPASGAPPVDRLTAATIELLQLRRSCDELSKSPEVLEHMPRQWRRLHWYLHRAETSLRTGDFLPADIDLALATELRKSIVKAQAAKFGVALDVADLTLAGSRAAPDALSKEEAALLDAVWPQLEKKMVEPALRDALTKLLTTTPAALRDFHRRLLVAGLDAKSGSRAAFLKLQEALSVLTFVNRDRVEPMPLPAELIVLDRIVSLAAEESEWRTDFGRLCYRILEARRDFEELALASRFHSELLGTFLSRTENELIAAERWLSAAAASVKSQGICTAHVGRVEAALSAFRKTMLPAVVEAKELRNQLLAELPVMATWAGRELDRARTATEVNDLDVLVNYFRKEFRADAPESISPELRDRIPAGPGRDVLSLVDATRQLSLLLEQRPQTSDDLKAYIDQSLKAQVTQCQAPRDKLRLGIEEGIGRLAAEIGATLQWDEIDAALAIEWLSADVRQRLLERLTKLRPAGAESGAKIGSGRRRGEWQAFFCLQTLILARTPPDKLTSMWKSFGGYLELKKKAERDRATSGAGDFVEAELRLGELAASQQLFKLGSEISTAWRQASRQLDRYRQGGRETATQFAEFARLERQTRCVHPADSIPEQALDPIHELQLQNSKSLGSWRAANWHQRARSADRRPEFELLVKGWDADRSSKRSADENPAPQLADLVDVLRFDRARKADFSVTVNRGASLAESVPDERFEDLRIELYQSSLEITSPEGAVETTVNLPSSDATKLSVSLQTQLRANVGLKSERMVVALMDRRTNLPLDVKLVSITPPVDPTAWRFVLVREDEKLTFNDPDTLAQINDRNRPVPQLDAEDAVPKHLVMLPPNAPQTPLQWMLIPPLETTVRTIESVQVFARLPNETVGKLPVAEAKNVELPASGGPVFLPLAAAAPATAPPATPVAAPGTPPAPAPGADVSNGFEVRMKLKGETTMVRHLIIPVIRDARELIVPIEPEDIEFQNSRLKVSVRRRANLDPAIPETFAVELKLPPKLLALKPQSVLVEKAVGAENAVELSATFNPEAFAGAKSDLHRVELHVSGVPCALAWNVANARASEEIVDDIKIYSPETRQTFKQGQPVDLLVSILSKRFTDAVTQKPWQLEWDVRRSAVGAAAGVTKPTLIKSLHNHATKLKFDGDLWSFQTKTTSHQLTRETEGQSGVFQVRAMLTPPAGVSLPTSVSNASSIEYAVDSPSSPPTVRMVGGENVEDVPLVNRPLTLRVRVADLESGVRRIAWGFDDNSSGQLELEKEEVGFIDDADWPQADEKREREFDILIPADRLPAQDSTKTLVVIVKDGLGTVCLNPAKRTYNFKRPPKTGTVTVVLKNLTDRRAAKLGRVVVQPSLSNTQPGAKVVDFNVPQQTGTVSRSLTVPIGTYTVFVGNNLLIDNAVVGEGKVVEVSFDASTLND